ncbi:transporter substrate-binding domain-containing protein [uncultured Rubinisphaera sp.]|uniref:nSTAND1 domain-containing NTPase n=1 Tax=uncultured Rubinisphaera sp. TaxID=1678686 RepID=UPI0030D99E20
MISESQTPQTTSNRWLGLRSYEEQDASLFYGRTAEINKLFRMIRRDVLTTIFAPSGTGKTSLLRAGLFPQLRKNEFLPVWIRLDHLSEDATHAGKIRERLEQTAVNAGLEIGSIIEPQANTEQETLWEYLYRVELWNQDNELVTPVLVIDQFEEIFTLGDGRTETEEFLLEFADIVEKRIPQAVRKRLQDRGEKLNIPIDTQGFRFVLSLRQDFVADLDDYRKKIPSLMRNRYPLHQLNGEQALEVVLGPGQGIVSEDVARTIVSIVSGKSDIADVDTDISSLQVEPNHLSLVCHELDQQRIHNGEREISASGLVEQSRDILRKFYEQSIGEVSHEARIFVEDNLLTATGYRKSQPLDDAHSLGLKEQDLNRLIDRHVVRLEEHKDIHHVELTHDLLTNVVQESRDRRHLEEEKQALLIERRQDRRNKQFYAIISSVLVGFVIFAFYLTYHANQSANLARESADRAKAAEQTSVAKEKEMEILLNFMTNDLYKKLSPIGQLDLLQKIAQRAVTHYKTIDLNKTTANDLFSQAQALNRVANVLERRGYAEEALNSFQLAMALLDEVHSKDKYVADDKMIIFQAELLIDYAAALNKWDNPESALSTCQKGLDLFETLTAANDQSDLEKLQGVLTLVDIYLTRGDFSNAESTLQLVLPQTDSQFSDYHKNAVTSNMKLTLISHFWERMSHIHLKRTEFPQAFKCARTSLQIISDLYESSPGNIDYLQHKCWSLISLAKLHLNLGDFAGARDKFEPVLVIAKQRIEDESRLAGLIENSVNQKQLSDQVNPVWRLLLIDVYRSLASAHILRTQYSSLHLGQDKSNITSDPHSLYIQALEEVGQLPANLKSIRVKANLHAEFGAFHLSMNPADGKTSPLSEVDLQNETPDETILNDNTALFLTKQSNSQFNDVVVLNKSSRSIAKYEYAKTILSTIELLKRYESENLVAETLQRAKAMAEQAMINDHTWLACLDLRISINRELASVFEKLGHTRHTIELLRKNEHLCRFVCEHDIVTIYRRRNLAENYSALGEILEWAEHTSESDQDALTQYKNSLQIYEKLSESSSFCLNDQLNMAKAQYSIGNLLQKMNQSDGSLIYLQKASENGWANATLDLIKQSKRDMTKNLDEQSLELKARRQQFQIVSLNFLFRDRLQNEVDQIINREVPADIVVTGPFSEQSYENSAIKSELNRVQQELGLVTSSETEQELKSWYHNMLQNQSSRLTLAELLELGFQSREEKSITSSDTTDEVIVLNSPIRSNYPSRTPTVIGNECWFRWEFNGTGRNLRSFNLQISLNDNFDTESVIVNTRVDGTSYRQQFGSEIPVPNQMIYWRVRQLKNSNLEQVNSAHSTNITQLWSETRKVEVYETVWKRIALTKKLRIGISEYEGDLLTWETRDIVPSNFDGKIINHIQKHLSKLLSDDKDLFELELEPYRYSWLGMFQAVSRNEVDLAVSAITRTQEREHRFGIRFSEPYYETQFVILTSSDNKLDSLDGIRDKKIKLEVTEGMRWGEISSIIAPDELTKKLTYHKIDVLFGHASKSDDLATLTDYAFIFKHLNDHPEDRNNLNVLTLTEQDFQIILDREQSEKKNDEKVEDILNLFRDYGGAANEQYAIAMSLQSTGLRALINQAILEFRRNQAVQACHDAGIPVAARLYGPDQVVEEKRQRATIVPESPSRQSESATVFGDKIEFIWYPISKSGAHYRFQLGLHPEFYSEREIQVDTITQNPTYHFDIPKTFPTSQKLYWRAKQIEESIEDPADDPFPSDGWCEPVEIQFHKNCLERIRHDKMLRVALNISNGDSVYRDKKRRLNGFDINIAETHLINELTHTLQCNDIEFVPMEMKFTEMFPSVQNFKADLAISGITATKEREEKFDLKFSLPYCRTRQAAVWLKDSPIKNLRDLTGKQFIVFEQTRAYTIANAFTDPSQVITIRSTPKNYLLEQLLVGNADVTVLDHPAAMKIVQQNKQSDQFHVEPFEQTDLPSDHEIQLVDNYAIAIQMNQKELIEVVNKTIQRLRSGEGEQSLDQIFDQYQQEYNSAPFDTDFDTSN